MHTATSHRMQIEEPLDFMQKLTECKVTFHQHSWLCNDCEHNAVITIIIIISVVKNERAKCATDVATRNLR